jgi:DNA repair exonuclease SbcCD ATPase subunit
MTRYFVKSITVEGFRGINNDGEPLELKFKPECVNSVFGANALGKSSIFEALSYALKGSIAKLDRLPAAEEPQRYYGNRFHGTGMSTITLVFSADDGSDGVIISVARSANGTRTVTSSTGHADPEAFLHDLDCDSCLLDYDQFESFVEQTPLRRGRTFSGLLGLSPLSEFRQALEVLSNTKNLKADFDIEDLDGSIASDEREAREREQSLRTAIRGFGSLDAPAMLDLAKIGNDTLAGLKSIAMIAGAVSGKSLTDVDFKAIREHIRNVEQGDKRDRLRDVVMRVAALGALAATADEENEIRQMREALGRRGIALGQTKGVLFYNLYSSVQQVYAGNVWTDVQQCPVCESQVEKPLPATMAEKLHQYDDAEKELTVVTGLWRNSTWTRRFQNLEDSSSMEIPSAAREHARHASKLGGANPSQEDITAAESRLKDLDSLRKQKLEALESEKSALQKELPPSLVSLTEQVEFGEQIQGAIKKLSLLYMRLSTNRAHLGLRTAWAEFISTVCDEFSTAEVALSTQKTTRLATNYRDLYKEVTKNDNIVPELVKSTTSEDLNLRLSNFYGLTDVSATTVLPESYRNALAICIYLSAILDSRGKARFVVLDDVTSSFDAGHQWALMEVIRKKIAYPNNPDGPQFIILSHDGLLEKYFGALSNHQGWHHQKLQGAPPRGMVFANVQDVNALEAKARTHLSAGQVDQADPLIRQCLEHRLLDVIRKLSIPVPIDFAIRDDKKMVGNCIDAIQSAVALHALAGNLILTPQQVADLQGVHLPWIVGNWLAHVATATTLSVNPYVLLGVLDAIDKVSDCFKYQCSCDRPAGPRFYASLEKKACSC